MRGSLETVVDLALPVAERLLIQRNRFGTGEGPRLVLCAGTHGDELEGQLVCALLAQALEEERWPLLGTVDLYPALNPLGLDTITRSLPGFEIDLNRAFDLEPGAPSSFVSRLTSGILDSLAGADLVIDIHASNIFLRELPQVRIATAEAARLLPWARLLGVDFLWVHEAVTVLKNTLAHSLNSRGTPCLVVEMGVGMRLTPAFAFGLLEGIGRVGRHLGVFGPLGPAGAAAEPGGQPFGHKPALESPGGTIHYLNSPEPGLFVPEPFFAREVEANQRLGRILDPLSGRELADILAPAPGLVFTLREYPVVYEGSLLARLFSPGGAP